MSKINKDKILIGTDPEAFLYDIKSDEIVSAIGIVSGTKDEPYSIGKGCHIQVDNILVEWCVPPTNSPKKLMRSLEHCFKYTQDRLPQGWTIKVQPFAKVNPKWLEDKKAKEAGCTPDYNVWKRCMNEAPDYGSINSRSAAGHIHIGYPDPTQETSEALIKAFDLYLGVPSIILDKDKERRKLYGKAGCFRFKNYGVEYRTLSNFWINGDIQLVEWVFRNVYRAIDYVNNKGEIPANSGLAKRIINTINKGNEKEAYALVKECNLDILEEVKQVKIK